MASSVGRRLVSRLRALHLSTLQVALLISVGVHAALLTVRFVDPQAFDRVFRDTPLEVVLVNARADEAPTQAQAIAQSNLAGGGESAEPVRATSPLPPTAFVDAGDSIEEARRRVEAMQEQQQQLLAQIRRELAVLPVQDPARQASDPEQEAQEERRRQLLDLLAQIERRINEENARPRKRYISPSTREAAYALYYDHLRRRIEERGTRQFPEHGGRKLYGELTMIVTVDAQGRVLETEVVQGSNNSRLDRQAEAIVRAASPFGPFTDEMRRRADQIVVVSRFRFTREEGLQTTLTDE